jgi:hypothetical protein
MNRPTGPLKFQLSNSQYKQTFVKRYLTRLRAPQWASMTRSAATARAAAAVPSLRSVSAASRPSPHASAPGLIPLFSFRFLLFRIRAQGNREKRPPSHGHKKLFVVFTELSRHFLPLRSVFPWDTRFSCPSWLLANPPQREVVKEKLGIAGPLNRLLQDRLYTAVACQPLAPETYCSSSGDSGDSLFLCS